jgi:hypothetical protein
MSILKKPLIPANFISKDKIKEGVLVKLVSAEAVNVPEDKKKYAAKEDAKLVKEGILQAGQTLKYTFHVYDTQTQDWELSTMENSSYGFYSSLSIINPDEETMFTIKRFGDGTDTKYAMKTVEKISDAVLVQDDVVSPF